MDISELYTLVGNLTYGALAGAAIWGAYCVILLWTRINQKRFVSEEAQNEFISAVEVPLSQGRFDEAYQLCDGDSRAVSQLSAMAIENRRIGFDKVRQMMLDRFQRDVLEDLETRLSWVNTMIKSAPMLGLFGTVLGMMGAFGKLAAGGSNVKPENLASDISLALITTAIGLAIAIPLIMCVTLISVRIRKLEDLSAEGLTKFLEAFRAALPPTSRSSRAS